MARLILCRLLACLCFAAASLADRPAEKAKHPQFVITYYDRNHDGIVDFELHHAVGWAGADWALSDTDFDGSYDLLIELGDLDAIRHKVSILVPGDVPITKEPPAHIRFDDPRHK